MSKEYIISFYRVILFTLFALLSTFNAGAQKEYSVYFYDSLRSRVIPVTVYSPSKVNKKTQVVIFNHGYDGNQNPKSNQTYSYLTRLGCICDETLHQLFCDWMVQWSKEPPPNGNAYYDYFAALFDENYRSHPEYQRKGGDWLNWQLPGTEYHIPIFQSGFGDGVYPVYWGFDEHGAICQLVIQFIDIELAYGDEEGEE